ncbi:TPA: LOW QUALITY PROTEIN: hypothetical protein N0F65_002625, partial [Lagenidium giganteum]
MGTDFHLHQVERLATLGSNKYQASSNHGGRTTSRRRRDRTVVGDNAYRGRDADDTANATPSPSPSPSPSSSPVANPAMAVDTWETGDLTPSSKLFQQTTAIQSMCAPRNINVRGATTSTSYGRPIPTNAWWSNLLACTPASSNSTNPIWSNPFALTLETGRDGDGLFGISMSYAYRNRFFGGTSGNGDSVKFYGHAIWAEALFSASAFKKTKPSFELADWSDLG